MSVSTRDKFHKNFRKSSLKRIDAVDTDIKRLLREMEVLGEQGKIEESEKLSEEVEQLRKTKDDLLMVAVNQTLASKQMKICDICGAKQSINDLEKRNLSHLEGKLHQGFQMIRTEYDKLKKLGEMVELNIEVKKEEIRRMGKSAEKEITDFYTYYESKYGKNPEMNNQGGNDQKENKGEKNEESERVNQQNQRDIREYDRNRNEYNHDSRDGFRSGRADEWPKRDPGNKYAEGDRYRKDGYRGDRYGREAPRSQTENLKSDVAPENRDRNRGHDDPAINSRDRPYHRERNNEGFREKHESGFRDQREYGRSDRDYDRRGSGRDRYGYNDDKGAYKSRNPYPGERNEYPKKDFERSMDDRNHKYSRRDPAKVEDDNHIARDPQKNDFPEQERGHKGIPQDKVHRERIRKDSDSENSKKDDRPHKSSNRFDESNRNTHGRFDDRGRNRDWERERRY